MITTKGNETTITCDKCKCNQTAPSTDYNAVFFNKGWALHKGRKYMHLCRSCQTPKSRRAMDWAREKFPI